MAFVESIPRARISHTCSSRSGGRDGLSELRHLRGHPLAGRTFRANICADAVEGV